MIVWGKIFDTYKKNKNPPKSYLCDNVITWCVNCCLNIVIDNCMICELCDLLKRRRHYELCDLLC